LAVSHIVFGMGLHCSALDEIVRRTLYMKNRCSIF
jgi:hypothetical protein